MSSDRNGADAPEHPRTGAVIAARGLALLIVVGSAAYSALASEAPFLTEASFRFGLGGLALMFAAPPVLLGQLARALGYRLPPAWRRGIAIVGPVLQGAVAAWAGRTAFDLPHVYFVQTVGWATALWTHAVALVPVLLAWWLKDRRTRPRREA